MMKVDYNLSIFFFVKGGQEIKPAIFTAGETFEAFSRSFVSSVNISLLLSLLAIFFLFQNNKARIYNISVEKLSTAKFELESFSVDCLPHPRSCKVSNFSHFAVIDCIYVCHNNLLHRQRDVVCVMNYTKQLFPVFFF